MSLRKSPRRTRALLAANRRNSRKSTGPRTELGKWHSSVNAVRHYRRTQFASCIPIENRESNAFEDLLSKLREAIIPADNAAGTEAVLLKAAEVWRVKRSFDRWIETRTEEDWLVLAAGAVARPRSWRLKLRRPGVSVPDWMVTASVCLRWGRGPGQSGGQSGGRSRRSTTEGDEKPDRPRVHTPTRMHAIVSVHSTGPRCCSEDSRTVGPGLAPAGTDPRAHPERSQGVGLTEDLDSQRTKPECYSSQITSENMSVRTEWDPAYAEAYALAERFVGWLMGWGKRTKPEYNRNQAAYKNMSAGGELTDGNPNAKSCEKFDYCYAEPVRSSAAKCSFVLLRTGSERGEGAQGKLREASRYFIENEMRGSFAVAQDDMHGPFSQLPSSRATWLRTRLGMVFRAMKVLLALREEYSQLPLFQAKPECFRKEGAYENMSKALRWLGTAASFLLNRGSILDVDTPTSLAEHKRENPTPSSSAPL